MSRTTGEGPGGMTGESRRVEEGSMGRIGGPEADEAPISPLQALVGAFVQPRRAFERMSSSPRFVFPYVLLVVAQVLLAAVVFQSGAVRNDAIAKMESRGAPPEQIERMDQFFDSPVAMAFGAVGGALAVAFILLLNAGILYFMANLMLGAKLTYRHYLSAAAHGGAVGLVDQLARTGLAVSRGTMDLRLGLGNLLGDELSGPGRMLDTATDPLLLWSTAVTALGVSVYARKGFGFGAIAVLPAFLLGILLSAMR